MSLAWGSLVLLIILLPGVLFFVGTYLPEQFTRETAERSALGQLAGTLLVAFAIHSLLYAGFGQFCGAMVPCVDIQMLLRALTIGERDAQAIGDVADNLRTYRWWILGYVLFTSAAGTGLGYWIGWLTVHGHLRGLTQHAWIYDLSVGDNFTVAYILTNVRQDQQVLMYQGFLKAFALQRDGRFSYVVLTDAMRGYMRLGTVKPETSRIEEWMPIGGSGLPIAPLTEHRARHTRRDRTYFVIEGEDFANVVFDRLSFDSTTEEGDIEAVIKRLLAERVLDVSQSRPT